jgi:hypothetical protein
MPFRRQRDYWRRPDGTQAGRQSLPSNENPTSLAE